MTKDLDKDPKAMNSNDLNNICDECRKEDESVFQNLIMTGCPKKIMS